MPKKILSMAFAVAVLAAVTVPLLGGGSAAEAHNAGPCNDSGEPGNSDYAAHHIVPLAKSGDLGHGGHIPGSHHGLSACNPSG